MRRFISPRSAAVLLSLAVAGGTIPCRAQTAPSGAATQSDTAGPLRVHVTAVQGGSQFRTDSKSKWQAVAAGQDFIEGVEFRTGPKGAVQFTVGTDQVYRVDRLTVLKVLRAALQPDGTIKTDVGMTYGRVSKDVDVATHPHQDTIVSPSATLAVRGTRVSLYDQPPFEPEAVSLTGAAVFQNLHGQLIAFGAKGGGTAKVNGDSTSAAQYQLQTIPVDPEGAFAGRSAAEQNLLASLANLSATQLGVFQNVQEIIAGKTFAAKFTSIAGALPAIGELDISIDWFSNVNSSRVDLTVISPSGGKDYVSPTHPGSSMSNRFFDTLNGNGNIASGTFGVEDDRFGNLPAGIYPTGTYTVTETLEGTATQSLSQDPSVTAKVTLFPATRSPSGVLTKATPPQANLSVTNPSVTYSVSVPITAGEAVSPAIAHKR